MWQVEKVKRGKEGWWLDEGKKGKRLKKIKKGKKERKRIRESGGGYSSSFMRKTPYPKVF